VITGPTATGKTELATDLAIEIDGEIISADSRQIYRNMNIGTGKDISEYQKNGKSIPYHLIDIINPGEKYSVYQFQKDFISTYQNICDRGKQPILCGGTGLYIESIIKGYKLPDVPENPKLRKSLKTKSLEELTAILASLKTLHNKTDVDTCNRAIRAIEIALFEKEHPTSRNPIPPMETIVLGIWFKRDILRKRITERLVSRINQGMIEEGKKLLDSGVDPEVLISYGLEYKFITWYLQGKISYEDFFSKLNTSIHQFAKRQVTWFRRMERQGIKIHWIDGNLPSNEKLRTAMDILTSKGFI